MALALYHDAQMAKPERSGAWPKPAKLDTKPAEPKPAKQADIEKVEEPADPRRELGSDHRKKLSDMAEDVAKARRVAEAGASRALIK